MKSPLRVLLLEDNPADAELILKALAGEGINCAAVRVETRADFLAAVEGNGFDLILSDFSLPSFDGLTALEIARAKAPEVPFIFVSGAMGEELAIETLKSGALDYVLKHRLLRLAPAVRRAMEEVGERAARHAAERSRSEAESLFRALFDQMAVGVAVADLSGRIVKANAALEAMLGYAAGQLSQVQLARLSDPEDAAAGAEAAEELYAGKRASYELEKRFVRRDGTLGWGRWVVSLIREDGGAPRFSIHLIEDITARKEMQKRFLQAEKMEVVGRVAAGFAHDFNNLLTLINGYSELLLERVPPQNPTRRELQQIRDAGERATTLTRRLLAFSRRQVERPGLLDLNSILTGLDQMLRGLIGDQVRLTLRPDPKAGLIEEDQTQIEQIVMNLAINARDAMPAGGELTIATGNTRLDGLMADSQGVAPGDYVTLTVADTGHGMDEPTQSRIFEPFFTTKEVGKGTGLGLWMVREIVQKSRGAVTVVSEPGRGTTFRICLPRVVAEAEANLAALARSVGRTSPGGAGALLHSVRQTLDAQPEISIVIADDDPAIRDFLRQVLRPSGYRVLEASNGRQAVQHLRQQKVDLLITDLIMPGQEGLETIQAVGKEFPDLRVVAMSGGFGEKFLGVAQTLGASEILHKPFSADEVREVVRRLLATATNEPIPLSSTR